LTAPPTVTKVRHTTPAAAITGRTAAVKVDVSETELVDELAEALRRCEFSVLRTGANTLHVSPGPAQHGVDEIPGATELELDLYLRLWEAMHPGARAARVP
jgi:hypothetical protein